MEKMIKKQLKEAGYDYAVAVATKAEIEAGAACGQLAIIPEGYIEQARGKKNDVLQSEAVGTEL